MTRLNFPVINQRTTTLSDGTLDPNRDWDCVQEVCAGILEYYTGKHFEGGVLKELLYGRNYRGGTDIHADVQLMAHYGVKVYPVDDAPDALVILAHRHIIAGHVVVITEDDPYMPAGSGYTHVIALYEEHAGGVTAMDPFIARDVPFTDAELANHIVGREVWIAEKIGANETVSISLTTPGVSAYFKAGSGNAWVCIEKGVVLHDGCLNYYRTMGGSMAGLEKAGLPLSNEQKPQKPPQMSANEYEQLLQYHPEIVEVVCERLILRYDPNHIMDKPVGSGSVYVVNRNQIPGSADTTAQQALQAQLDAAVKLNADLQKKIQVAEDALKA